MSKAWYLRNGIQVITDLAACKEHELDMSLPIEVEGIPVDSQASCRNTLSLLAYLDNTYAAELAPLLKDVGMERSLTHLRDPHKWVSYVDCLKVFELTRRLEASRNPRHFKTIGRHAHRYQSMGAGVDALANLLPLRQVMWLASEYGRLFNNGQFVRSVRKSRGEIVLISKFARYAAPVAVIDWDWWALGIYTGFPERRGLPPAEGTVDYTLFSVETLLDREYAWLGIRDHGVRTEWTYHGLARKRWFVGGEEYAHEVILLRESLVPGASVRGNDLFHPSPRELEDFTPEQLAGFLDKRLACTVWLVTKTLEQASETVVQSGEIYGAPYSRFTVRWHQRSWLDGLREAIGQWRQRMFISAKALRTEIEAAKAEAMHATRERVASEQKSIIFQSYARRSLVNRIDRGEDPRDDKPCLQELSILFADLCGFTQLASRMSPEDTVAFLNAYFNRLNRPIYHHNGEIDKIMGDGMMAVFADRQGLEPMAVRSVQAAIDIRLELQAYNRERREWHARHPPDGEHFTLVDNGIGIAFGSVVTGNIGSNHKLDHSLIGDVVNIASRLEGLTRYYRTAILVTQEVRDQLPNRFHVRFLDTVRVKGRDQSIKIFEVYDHEPNLVKDTKTENQPRMEAAWELYAAGMFTESRHIYEDLIRSNSPHPSVRGRNLDPTLAFFLARCRNLEAKVVENPDLLSSWMGVHGFDTK